MNPKVSVIIPVWNPGDGIRRCVASLRNQTLKDIEMIFVDDCGTDGAMDVVRAAAAEDPRIRVITNSGNLGAGASRNAAIEWARGEYLAFVDADDYVDSEFLELLYKKGRAENLDIVKGSIVYELGRDKAVVKDHLLNDTIRAGLSRNEPLFCLFIYQFTSAIFHHRLFANGEVRFGLVANDEDTVFLLKAAHQTKGFGLEQEASYHYVYRSDSAVNATDAVSLENRASALREQVEYLKRSVEPSPFAVKCFARKLKDCLAMQQHVARIKGMEEAASRFLSELREMTLGYPEASAFKKEDFTLYALAEYGENLSERPYKSPWGRPLGKDYADLAVDWVKFCLAHPEGKSSYSLKLKWFLETLCAFVMAMGRNGCTDEEVASVKTSLQRLFSQREARELVSFVNLLWYCAAGMMPLECANDEPINHEELYNHVKYRVDDCNQMMAKQRNEEAQEIIGNIGRMLRLSPSIKSWAERANHLEVRAVYDYAAPLRLRHWGVYRTVSNYRQMLENWRVFFKAHPDCDPLYFEGFASFLSDAKGFVEEKEGEGYSPDVLGACKRLAERGWGGMPLRARLRKRIIEKRRAIDSLRGKESQVISQGSMDFTLGMPLVVDWTITSFCNFRCSYCFVAGTEYKKDFCTLEQAETAIRHIASSNRSAYQVSLIGGETTAHPHLAEIITLLRERLGDRLERISIISNGSFSERQMETILASRGQTEMKLMVSVHLEYMGVDRAVALVKRLSNHVVLEVALMFHPDLFDKAKEMADALCELRKEYPFQLEISELREPPKFDRWDSRYTQQHLDWVEETRRKINHIAANGPKGIPTAPKKVNWCYWAEKRTSVGDKIFERVDMSRLEELTQYKFGGMTCCAGVNVIKINLNGYVQGMVCKLDRSKYNIFEENPFGREDWIHGVKCSMQMCGCGANYRIPKFRSEEEAEKFMAERREEQKRLMSEYRSNERQS